MATPSLKSIVSVLLPKRSNPKGTSLTPTFNPSSPDAVLTVPTYRDHLTDIFDTRSASDSRALIKQLFVSDPDMSAAVHSRF